MYDMYIAVNPFLSKLIHSWYCEKSITKKLLTKTLLKLNSRQIGENYPNLVTLAQGQVWNPGSFVVSVYFLASHRLSPCRFPVPY
jgi:hypothetical protein